MNKNYIFLLIPCILFIFPIHLAFSDVTAWIPPTNAFNKIHTSNATLNAKNYSAPFTVKGIGKISVTGSDFSKTIYINATLTNGTNGKNGINGTNGINGKNGTNGSNGLTLDTISNVGKGGHGFYTGNDTNTHFKFRNLTSLRPDLFIIDHNVTDTRLNSTFKAPNKNCGASNFLQGWINTTGFTCAAGNLGTITTGSNVGKGGFGPFKDTTGTSMNFKNLTSTTKLLTISQNLTDTMINSIFKLNSVTCGVNLFVNVISNSTISSCALPLNTAQLTNQFTTGGVGFPIALDRTNATNTPIRSLNPYDGINGYVNNTSILETSLTTNQPVISNNFNNNTSTGSSGTSKSLTFTGYTTVNGNNRLLLVGVSYSHVATVTNVTYNRLPLQKITSVNDGTRYEELWYLKNPPIGTFNIVANQSSTSEMIILAGSFFGVNQTVSIGATGTNTGSGNVPIVVLTTTKTNSVLVDLQTTTDIFDTPQSPQRYIALNEVPSLITSQSSYKKTDGIGSYQMRDQFNDGTWISIASELLPINPVNFTDTNTNVGTANGLGLILPKSNQTNTPVRSITCGSGLTCSNNNTNTRINDTDSGNGITSINGQGGPALNLVRTYSNNTEIINASSTKIQISVKPNVVLTNGTNQTITKDIMINKLTLQGVVKGKNSDLLNIGNINNTRFCYKTTDFVICGLNPSSTNPILNITPYHSIQSNTIAIGPNGTTGSTNQTSLQILTTNLVGSIGSKYLEIKGIAGSKQNFTINTQSLSTGNPYSLKLQWNGSDSIVISPFGGINQYPKNGYDKINGTFPPPLWVIDYDNQATGLKSVIALIAQSSGACGIGCGPGTDWDVKYPGSNGMTTLGGINFACIVSNCSQGVFEINDGKTNGGVIRFGIYDNGSLNVLNGQMINLDSFRGTQTGLNIGSFSKNFIQYLNNTGTKIVSGNVIMAIFNGTNKNIEFAGNNQLHNNATIIIRGGAFSLTQGSQTQTIGNGTALYPNLKGTVDYVAMWGIKNNFTKVFTGYNKTTTKGMGFPTIVNETNNGGSPIIAIGLTANSTGTKGGTYWTPTNAKSLFEVNGLIRVTAVTGGTVYMRVDFTDDAGTAQVVRIPMDTKTGILFTETATGYYSGNPVMISSNANKITCRTIATGTITYDMSCQIRQLG